MKGHLLNKLRLAQLKDVHEMQQIYEAAATGGNADEACEKVIGGRFALTTEVWEGIEQHARRGIL